ncbi:hypothetical protein BCR34DRAFT_368046 [Clohesyomyces aquaticus]|uniref:Zn(2)-C6 fungal-type domain-containing protein n=1 Tax=Clohesyomyces aquaticus TaxID=1231657 RepID=A0A1Y1ZHE8_9PLEO|nr:hypothetical protein BCR34DRAFT_368046 [Clohesyomyces aquaticus]
MNTGNLIACSACARAKVKCDKKLPTCSRCLYKRLQCEPRPTRRSKLRAGSKTLTPSTRDITLPQTRPRLSTSYSVDLNFGGLNADATASRSRPVTQNRRLPEDPDIIDLLLHQPSHTGTFNIPSEHISLESGQPGVEQNGFVPFPVDYDMTSYDFGSQAFSTLQEPSTPFLGATNGLLALHINSSPHTSADHQANNNSSPDAEESWPCFQCNPPSSDRINPRIGSDYLHKLEDTLNDQSVWDGDDFFTYLPPVPNGKTVLRVEPVQSSLRDKLMAISQGFLSRARDIHRVMGENTRSGRCNPPAKGNISGFFILPPPLVLQVFLWAYASRVEPYLPCFPTGIISLTQLVNSHDEHLSVLLILLMAAHGAIGIALPEARHFASGLIEICRLSMFDLLEKNVELSSNPVMLRCALLYVHAAAWSGTKWHMDLSAAQLRLFTSMVKHSGMLKARKSSLADMISNTGHEVLWKVWQCEQMHNRLVYSYVALDQELSLFLDREPSFDIGDLRSPSPEGDDIWNARTAETWRVLYDNSHRSGSHPLSGAELFSKFMGEEHVEELSPVELRLLLQPLQTFLYHLNKSATHSLSHSSQRLLHGLLNQLEEARYLLKRWYTIWRSFLNRSDNLSITTNCTMVLFHLISLNSVTYFPDIERLARGEMDVDTFLQSPWGGKRYSKEAHQIWCYSGQVIRHFRRMPNSNRPFWWSGALYRVALCMWVAHLSTRTHGPHTSTPASELEHIAMDTYPLDHPSILRYLRRPEGQPVFSRSDGSPVLLQTSTDAVRHCIVLLKEMKTGSQLDEEIVVRLSRLAERWKS